MKKSKLFILSFLSFAIFTQLLANKTLAFVISSEENCLAGAYQIKFENGLSGFITGAKQTKVYVSTSALSPDLRIEIVRNPQLADLFLVDRYQSADMSVCMSDGYSNQTNKINIVLENSEYQSDIRVHVSEYMSNPDYSLYVESEIFDAKMAAALFAVLWRINRTKENEVTTQRQPNALGSEMYNPNSDVMRQHRQMQKSIRDSLFD